MPRKNYLYLKQNFQRRKVRFLYGWVLDQLETLIAKQAASIEGYDHEILLMRAHLGKLIHEAPAESPSIPQAVNALIRLLELDSRRKASKNSQKDIVGAVAKIMEQIAVPAGLVDLTRLKKIRRFLWLPKNKLLPIVKILSMQGLGLRKVRASPK
jgi:hypothetical protein